MATCYDKHICAFCQREVTEDPIIADSTAPSNYRIESLKPYTHDTRYHVFYMNPEILTQIQHFYKFPCKQCKFTCTSPSQFRGHVCGVHHLKICRICESAHRCLPSNVVTYKEAELQSHLKQHPKCPVCPFQAFDDSVLIQHMRDNHFRCEICANHGVILWFLGMETLQVHLHSEHFACDDPVCVAQRVVAFETRLELHLHRVTVHGESGSVELDFEPVPDEPNWRAEREVRAKNARKKLKADVKRAFPGQGKKTGEVLAAIDALENGKIRTQEFFRRLERSLGEQLDGLFCQVAAAIRIPTIRADIVRVKAGVDGADIPPEPMRETLPPPPPVAQNPTPRRGKRTKKIVLFSS